MLFISFVYRWVEYRNLQVPFIFMVIISMPKYAFQLYLLGTFQEAVVALNTLQSNAATVEKIKEQKDAKRHVQIAETVQTAERAGVSVSI